MPKLKGSILLIGAAFALSQAPDIATGQGKGQGEGKAGEARGKGGAPGQAKGKGQAKAKGKAQAPAQAKGKARGQAKGASQVRGKFVRVESPSTMPQSVRRFATSRRAQDVIAAAAVSHAFARGRGDKVRLVEDGNGIRIANLRGDPLVYLDENRARDLGRWRVGVVDDEIREGSPAFCRSGEGHPVWGRDWCIDKGFGLGGYQDYRWGRTNDVGRIVFPGGGLGTNLIGSALESVIGTSAFNRLALHAVTLGLVEPLTGYWVPDDTGPRVLMVNSGSLPVAEFVDQNRDNSVDNLLVALRTW